MKSSHRVRPRSVNFIFFHNYQKIKLKFTIQGLTPITLTYALSLIYLIFSDNKLPYVLFLFIMVDSRSWKKESKMAKVAVIGGGVAGMGLLWSWPAKDMM